MSGDDAHSSVTARSLRVAFVHREEMTLPGGHKVQRESLANALRDQGVEVHMVLDSRLHASAFDVVHIFDGDIDVVRAAHASRRPVVVTPVYISASREPKIAEFLAGRARTAASLAWAAARGRQVVAARTVLGSAVDRQVLYNAADLLIPNSVGEMSAIRADLGVTTPMVVVPNGIEVELFERRTELGRAREGVLCVSRIEPHKNQLVLLRALRGTGIRVTLAGWPHPDHAAYFERVRACVGSDVEIVGPVPRAELGSLYSKHKVHALPSWFETTGLVSLEAAAAGCNVVTTARGYAGEYFGDAAWYCDPSSRKSIRDAVLAAHTAPLSEGGRRRIEASFSMRRVAEMVRDAYVKLVG